MKPLVTLLAVLLVVAGISGCDSSNSGNVPPGGSGTLTIQLTDAPSETFKAIYLSITQVEVKIGDDGDDTTGWQVVGISNKTINLLALTGGVAESLGSKPIASGIYSQLRLRLASASDEENNINGVVHPHAHYAIDNDNNVHPLTLASGLSTSGIKFTTAIVVPNQGTTRVLLDMDATESVVQVQGGNWLFNPVVRIGISQQEAKISGSITDTSSPTPNPLEGGRIYAQTYDSTKTHVDEKVTVHAATLTDSTGDYTLYVTGKTYNFVTSFTDRRSVCRQLEAEVGETQTVQMSLVEVTPGTLSITVSGLTSTTGPVKIRIFKEGTCGGSETIAYQIKSFSVGGDGIYTTKLPPDTYKVVASGPGLTTQRPADQNISSGTTNLTLAF